MGVLYERDALLHPRTYNCCPRIGFGRNISCCRPYHGFTSIKNWKETLMDSEQVFKFTVVVLVSISIALPLFDFFFSRKTHFPDNKSQ